MHAHHNPSVPAACRGGGRTGMWQTPQAKANAWGPTHPDEESPRFDCTCGFYGYRTYNAAMVDGQFGDFLAHVTCIEKGVLHEEGFRAQRYRVDYILAPLDWDKDTYIWTPGTPALYGMAGAEVMPVSQAVEPIAHMLQVDILDRADPRGCHICQVINGWRAPEDADIVLPCQCKHVGQDALYGYSRRRHHYEGEKQLWRCSGCGKMRVGPRPEGE